MNGIKKTRRLLVSTPGVVGHGAFAQHGIARNSAAEYIKRLRRDGWPIANVPGLGWRLRMTCQARQYSDQMQCGRCALQWDTNDTNPPGCRPVRLVAFAGRKGVGKDTAARLLVDRGYENIKFADGLKTMLRALLAFRGCPVEEIERMIEGDLKEAPSDYLNGRSPRYAMQTLGTDWGRLMMHRNFWVDVTRDRLKGVEKAVVTDARFQNEIDMIHEEGGETVLIEGPATGSAAADEHASERLISTLKTGHRIRNEKTRIEDFLARVENLFFVNNIA